MAGRMMRRGHESTIVAEAVHDLFLEEVQLGGACVDALALRKNLILQGPGVGKTFIARRDRVVPDGLQGPSAIEIGAVHTSPTHYEDFGQGWRPTEMGGFALPSRRVFLSCQELRRRAGQALRLHHRRDQPWQPLRIFGELRDAPGGRQAGAGIFAIPLTYSPA